MKTPLLYQLSEFDCGPITLYNALKYLFNRSEISYEVIKEIMNITLDKKEKGTSKKAMKKVALSLKKYLPLNIFIYEGNAVTPEIIKKNNNPKTVFILRTKLCCEHYVLITDFKKNYYLWDPYYLNYNIYQNNKVKIYLNKPLYNRVVLKNYFESSTSHDFTLGSLSKRQLIILKRRG